MKKHTEYMIAIIGSVITIIVGILEIIFGTIWISVFKQLGIYLGIWGVGSGIMMIVGAQMFKKDPKSTAGPLITLIFGIAGVISLQGWIIGPALGIIAAALILAKK